MRRAFDLLLRICGAVVALWGAVLLALFGTFLTPFRVGSVLVPVSVVLAVGGNVVLMWFAYQTTEHRFLALLPGLAWVALAFLAADRTTEGDVVLYQANWVSVVYLLSGSATVGVVGYRLFLRADHEPGRMIGARPRS